MIIQFFWVDIQWMSNGHPVDEKKSDLEFDQLCGKIAAYIMKSKGGIFFG